MWVGKYSFYLIYSCDNSSKSVGSLSGLMDIALGHLVSGFLLGSLRSWTFNDFSVMCWMSVWLRINRMVYWSLFFERLSKAGLADSVYVISICSGDNMRYIRNGELDKSKRVKVLLDPWIIVVLNFNLVLDRKFLLAMDSCPMTSIWDMIFIFYQWN